MQIIIYFLPPIWAPILFVFKFLFSVLDLTVSSYFSSKAVVSFGEELIKGPITPDSKRTRSPVG
jgi:hypothetical protein